MTITSLSMLKPSSKILSTMETHSCLCSLVISLFWSEKDPSGEPKTKRGNCKVIYRKARKLIDNHFSDFKNKYLDKFRQSNTLYHHLQEEQAQVVKKQERKQLLLPPSAVSGSVSI